MASAASGSSSAPKQKQSLSAEVEAIAQELKKYTENLTGTLQKSINEQNNMMKTAVAMGEASSKMAAKLKRIHNSVAKEQAELRGAGPTFDVETSHGPCFYFKRLYREA